MNQEWLRKLNFSNKKTLVTSLQTTVEYCAPNISHKKSKNPLQHACTVSLAVTLQTSIATTVMVVRKGVVSCMLV